MSQFVAQHVAENIAVWHGRDYARALKRRDQRGMDRAADNVERIVNAAPAPTMCAMRVAKNLGRYTASDLFSEDIVEAGIRRHRFLTSCAS